MRTGRGRLELQIVMEYYEYGSKETRVHRFPDQLSLVYYRLHSVKLRASEKQHKLLSSGVVRVRQPTCLVADSIERGYLAKKQEECFFYSKRRMTKVVS